MDLASLKYSYVLATSEVIRHWSALSCSAVQQLELIPGNTKERAWTQASVRGFALERPWLG